MTTQADKTANKIEALESALKNLQEKQEIAQISLKVKVKEK